MLDAADWTAIGTFALATGTFVLAVATVATAAADRRHDDRKRADDRARDDRLRQEQRAHAEKRDQADRRTREDFEARQVLVVAEVKENSADGHTYNRRVTISAPHAYPVKHVEGRFVIPSADWKVIEFGHRGEPAYVDVDRVYYSFWAEVPPAAFGAAPLVRFIDWRGNLYYQYQHYTERFDAGTDWLEAVKELAGLINSSSGNKSDLGPG